MLFLNNSSKISGNFSSNFSKFKKISAKEGERVLGRMDYADRKKLKETIKSFSGQQASIDKISKVISKEHSPALKRKFLAAVGKRYNSNNAADRKRNIKAVMAKDMSALEKDSKRTESSILGKVGGGVHGSASRLGVKKGRTGFANQAKETKDYDSKSISSKNNNFRHLGFRN